VRVAVKVLEQAVVVPVLVLEQAGTRAERRDSLKKK